MKKALILLLAGVLMSVPALFAQGPPPPPLTQKELVDILKSKAQSAQAAAIVEQRGVAFELTPEIEKQLLKAKATPAVIEAVKNGTPEARAKRAAAEGATIASEAEQQEMVAIQQELNPDAGIQLAADFEKKYPKSPLLTYVLALSAAQYENKGDLVNVVAQCEKSLALKSDNLMALLVIAHALPQQQLLRNASTAEVVVKLDRAEKYATQAMELIGGLSAQPNESAEQFATRKASYLQEMHAALGMAHLQRAMAMPSLGGGPDADQLTKAEAEYELAVTITGHPTAVDYYRLGEVRGHLKKYDAAIEAYTRSAELDQSGNLKTYTDQAIASLQKAKGQAPAKP
jgi:tetratricopeptide (TPR) repeat protein